MRVKHLAIITAALAATVGVTARADSINNYQVLKYLESSGTQAIDTGVKYGPTTRMRFRMHLTAEESIMMRKGDRIF